MDRQATILLVEDELPVFTALASLVRSAGYGVERATGGSECLRLARQVHPDAVLVKASLGDLGGIQVCRQIVADPETADISVLLYSADQVSSEAKAEGLEAGADDYLILPVSDRELLARLKGALRLRQADHARRRGEEGRAEGALRRERDLVRSILDSSPDGITIVDLQGTITDCNPAAWQMMGRRSREEYVGQSILTFLPETARAYAVENAMGMLREGSMRNAEYTLLAVDGREFPAEVSAAMLYGVRGEPVGIVGVLKDVSRRKRAEKVQAAVYRISESTGAAYDLQDLFRAIHGIVGELMPAQNFYIALYDPADESLSFPYFVDEHDRTPAPRKLGKGLTEYVLRTGKAHLAPSCVFAEQVGRGEVELVGTPPCDWLGVPLKANDRLIGVLAVQSYTEGIHFGEEEMDILMFVSTQIAMAIERKRAEEDLRHSEQKYRGLAEMLPQIVFEMDRASKLTFVNRAAYELLGYSSEDLDRGIYAVDSMVPGDRQRVRENILRSMRGEKLGGTEYTVVRKDGSTFPVIIYSAPIFRDGQPVGLRGILVDITERRQAEEERQRLQAHMQQVQKLESLGVLAGGIAHDFNNLLVAILGNADLALTDLPSYSPARENLEEIKKAALRASELSSQMLAYSGRGRFVLQPVSLNELIQDMGRLLQASVSKKATLGYELASDLPAVVADVTQIRQVIVNLISNASEALGDLVGAITVRTGVQVDPVCASDSYLAEPLPEGRYVSLEVTDTGCGMDRATQARVFDPFFTTKFTGRGLGLAAVLGIVRGHKGAIAIDSAPGKGSTFTVFFPATDQAAVAIGRPDRPRRQSWKASGTVLVVDDEEAVCRMARTMLERFGFTVCTAGDGVEALRILRGDPGKFAAVLLDVTMPRMSGEDTLRALRSVRGDIPVILTSGYDEQETIRHFAGQSWAGFVQKPFQLDALAGKLRAVIEKGEPH